MLGFLRIAVAIGPAV